MFSFRLSVAWRPFSLHKFSLIIVIDGLSLIYVDDVYYGCCLIYDLAPFNYSSIGPDSVWTDAISSKTFSKQSAQMPWLTVSLQFWLGAHWYSRDGRIWLHQAQILPMRIGHLHIIIPEERLWELPEWILGIELYFPTYYSSTALYRPLNKHNHHPSMTVSGSKIPSSIASRTALEALAHRFRFAAIRTV